MAAPPPSNVMQGVPAHITALLDELHALSLDQESKIVKNAFTKRADNFHEYMADKFIALEQDKAQYVYQLARATGARCIVEAGTSFGVSTIYLALAASANAGTAGKVVATEHEPDKAARAREYWAKCGEQVSSVIDLRVGDLRETLKTDLHEVDFLLLDIWTPMVMPTVKLVQPRMKRGAVIIADNVISSHEGYKEYMEYIRDPENGFITMTLPFKQGLEMSVYLPRA